MHLDDGERQSMDEDSVPRLGRFPISFPFGIDLVCFLLFAISNDVDRPEQSCSIAESNAPGERIPLAHSWLRPSNYAYRQLSSA